MQFEPELVTISRLNHRLASVCTLKSRITDTGKENFIFDCRFACRPEEIFEERYHIKLDNKTNMSAWMNKYPLLSFINANIKRHIDMLIHSFFGCNTPIELIRKFNEHGRNLENICNCRMSNIYNSLTLMDTLAMFAKYSPGNSMEESIDFYVKSDNELSISYGVKIGTESIYTTALVGKNNPNLRITDIMLPASLPESKVIKILASQVVRNTAKLTLLENNNISDDMVL